MSHTDRRHVALTREQQCSHWIKGPASPQDEASTESKSTLHLRSRSEMGIGVVGRGDSLRSASPTAMYAKPAAQEGEDAAKEADDALQEGTPIFDDRYFMELLEANNPQMKEGSTIVTI